MSLICITILLFIVQIDGWTAGNGKFQWLSPIELGKCSLHGSYVFAKRSCACDPGWGHPSDISLAKSPRCDVRICPAGHSLAESVPASTTIGHSITECSGAGLCDRTTGQCVCFDGFKGRSCERFHCPKDCSGKGRCLNMQQMAQEDEAFPLHTSLFKYGTYDTIETTSWDQNRTFGCLCDSYSWNVGLDAGEHQLAEFFGPDCSLRRCPSGNDPMTTTIDETDCKGKYNNGASTAASITTSVSQNVAASATSTTITHVAGARAFSVGDSVTISGHSGNAANTAMNQIYVVASVTSATVAVLTGTGMTAATYTSGTLVATFSMAANGNLCHIECSNRGTCNHKEGLCTCFGGYYGNACQTMNALASSKE